MFQPRVEVVFPGTRLVLQHLKLIAIILVLASACSAQIPQEGDTTSTPIPAAGHNYIHAPLETVNPANGSLSIRIPVRIPAGREMTLPFDFSYDSNGVDYLGTNTPVGLAWLTNHSVISLGGWSNTAPTMSANEVSYTLQDGTNQTCAALVDYVMQDATGNRHNLDLSVLGQTGRNLGGDCSTGGYGIYLSGGQAPILATTTEPPYPGLHGIAQQGVVVTDGNGTQFGFPSSSPAFETELATRVTDRNGNYATITPPTTWGGAWSMEDTVGRTVLSDSGYNSSPELVSVPSRTYSVNWETLPNPSLSTTLPDPIVGGSSCPQPNSVAGLKVVSKIALPNGQSFSFYYDSASNRLDKIVYPSGGYVRYVWGRNSQSEFGQFPDSLTDPQSVCSAIYDTEAVTDRYVSLDGSTEVLHQHFQYFTTWYPNSGEWESKETKVFTTDLVRNTTFETDYVYSSVPSPGYPNETGNLTEQIPVEETITYKDTNGSVLKTVTKSWFDDQDMRSEEVTLPNGQSSFTAYCIDTNAQITEEDDYDYGAGTPSPGPSCGLPSNVPVAGGSLIRKIATTYATFTGNHIVDLPSSVVTYDGSGTRVAETDSSYDQTSLQSTSVVQHTTAPGGSARGNLTTVTKQCFNGSCAGGSPVTKYSYFDTGQVYQMTDPRNNVTTYSYTDSYTSCGGNAPPSGAANAYLTQVTYPATNGASHVKYYCYDYTGGTLGSSTDENTQTTSYAYLDPLYRLTKITYPDGGETTVTYNDAPPTPSVTVSKEISSGQFLTNVTVTDGMGLPTESELTSDPSGTDLVLTTYDGLGRRYTVTNPYRSTSDPTYGTTTYYYDELNRTVQMVEPDGSAINTSYLNNCTTVTDEQGKARESCTDGLGRLTSVIEDPTGLDYATSYGYDALGNLNSVLEDGSRQRTFTYDSLSQLTQAINPESGTINYAYDANGNLTSKTAPEPNQTGGATVTTTYAYDALNRLTEKSYSDATPTVYFNYDGATQSGCTASIADSNPKPYRTGMCDAAGSEAWSYDLMGRVLTDQRTTNSVTRSFVYTYSPYVDGAVANIAYPSGLSLTYTYDGAGRFSSAKDQYGNTYVSGSCGSGACYAPQGALQSATMDANSNFAGFAVTDSYTKRLQPNELKVTNGGTSVMDLSYCFYALSNGACPTGTNDNGNVMGMINNMDTTRSQTFTYDSLNRLATGASVNTSGTNCWSEQYGYDPWGNLLSIAKVSGYSSCAQPDNLSISVTAANQISGYTYDSAGNLIDIPGTGGATYTYNAAHEMTTSSAGVNYVYDGDGNRVEKSSGTLYWYGVNGAPLEETNLTGGWLRDYIFFNGQRIAARTPTAGLLGFFANHLASTSKLESVSSTGTVTLDFDADYYPFGRAHQFVDSYDPAFKFTGKERDEETGLDNFGARYFTSNMGRFMSPDPLAGRSDDPQSWNMYAYCRGNPTSLTDPTGRYFVVNPGDEKFFQAALTSIYQRPGGRSLVEALAASNRPVILGRAELGTAQTGIAGKAMALAVKGQSGVAGVSVTVGSDRDLFAGAKQNPGQVGSAITTAHELAHASAGLTAGKTSLASGAAAMAAGDKALPGTKNNTLGGTAQATANSIMHQKTDLSRTAANSAIEGIFKSGNQQWLKSTNRRAICAQNAVRGAVCQ